MRILPLLAATAAAVCMATAASATAFVGTYNVNLNTNGNGLLVDATPSPGNVNFNLTDAGDTTGYNGLFDLYTPESSLQSDDFIPQTITVNFTFTAPTDFGGTISGETVGVQGFLNEHGDVTWNGPVSMSFGNGGVLTVQLKNATFNQGFFIGGPRGGIGGLDPGPLDGATIKAKFSLTNPSAAVPEPASWALMIGGFGMAGGMLRRRRTATAVTA